jgi:hypothetical protein
MEYKAIARSGSAAIRAAAIGATAVGAFSVGALAVGALAIGRLAIRRARIKTLDIDEINLRHVRGWTMPRVDASQAGATSMTAAAVANEYVSLCRHGKFDEAIARLVSRDHDVHGVTIDGPFMADDRFAVRFAIDATFRPTGERRVISKMDLYTVAGGRMVRSEVFYNAPLE